MITARLRSSELLSKNFSEPLRLATSRVLIREAKQTAADLESIIKEAFWFPDKPERLRELSFKKTGQRVTKAELRYKYQVVPLGRYPTRQYRNTFSSLGLRVSRGKPFTGHSKRSFDKQVLEKYSMATFVQIRKSGRPKLVHGKLGFKGWLHTGHKETFNISAGQKFAAAIFERKQQRTWKAGKRQPIHQLFAPSLTDLMKSKEIQTYFKSGKAWQTVQTIINEEFSRG